MRITIIAILGAILAAGLSSCANVAQGGDSLSVVAENPSARTILPASFSIAKYRASGQGPSGASIPSTTQESGSFSFTNLAAGSWTVAVQGLDGSGNVVCEGAGAVSV